MTTFVFDTGALSLFFAEDERLRPFVEKIHAERAEGVLASVTLAEFYYKTCQTLGRDVAALRSRQISERMQVVAADLELSLSAGLEKCRNNRLSLADSYVLALTKQINGLLLTTDSELAKNKETRTPVRHFEV